MTEEQIQEIMRVVISLTGQQMMLDVTKQRLEELIGRKYDARSGTWCPPSCNATNEK